MKVTGKGQDNLYSVSNRYIDHSVSLELFARQLSMFESNQNLHPIPDLFDK